MILRWDNEDGLCGRWKVIHYTHNLEDMERMMQIYPQTQGYVHMIDINWIKSHEIMKTVQECKAKWGVK